MKTINHFFLICFLTIGLKLVCSDQKSTPTQQPTQQTMAKNLFLTKLTNCFQACPTRTRTFTRRCDRAFDACCDFCNKNPEVTPLTAAGLIVVAACAPISFTAGLSVGLVAGVPIGKKYFIDKQD